MEKLDGFEEFKLEHRIIDGKKTPVIKARVEEKIKPDGSKDVIIHAPALSLINEAIKGGK